MMAVTLSQEVCTIFSAAFAHTHKCQKGRSVVGVGRIRVEGADKVLTLVFDNREKEVNRVNEQDRKASTPLEVGCHPSC